MARLDPRVLCNINLKAPRGMLKSNGKVVAKERGPKGQRLEPPLIQ